MKGKVLIIICLPLISVGLTFILQNQQDHELLIAMLDIGQGDAIYIRTPQGTDMLIDGGPDRSLLAELGAVMPPYDHKLELVVATHPDADHIAGLAELPDLYNIDTLITSGTKKSTGFSRELDSWSEKYNVRIMQAYRGWRLDLEPDLWLEFFNPAPPNWHEDVNDDSIVFILHYREFAILLTGDAPLEIEKEIITEFKSSAVSLDVDILKVGHHGSRTSTGQQLLQTTSPAIALISVGWQNKFAHPHDPVIKKIERAGISTYRTDLQGRIICTSDGYQYHCAAASTQ